jgi:CRISPR system Cascade subunit CasA
LPEALAGLFLNLNGMMTMNLTTNPWIPATRNDGSRGLFSLQELFAEAHQLRDLAVKPHERIALMRLLICITQAALDGPTDEEDWEQCEPSIQPKVAAYLEKWAGSFELFGEGPRFLQLGNLQPGKETDEGNASTKLDLALATGNNPTLFDNRSCEQRAVDPVRAPLNLLTFQCFSPGGRIGVARWNGKDTPGKGASGHAPCTPSSMIHSLILGTRLLETLRLNLLSQETVADSFGSQKWGQPIWESPVQSGAESVAVGNATGTYLGRLVPVSRAIRLKEDGVSVILANGLEYPIYPAYREATATIRKMDKETKLLPASTGRSLWRQLSAISVKRRSDGDPVCGPLALGRNFSSRNTTLWVGALITDKAKIEEVIESVYTLPSEMFSDLGRAAFENGVNFAGKWEFALKNSLKEYAATLKVVDPPVAQAAQVFWTRLEQHLSDLFEIARNPDLVADLPACAWGRAVKAATHDAYQQSCPRQTPRQIEAYARGLRKLSVRNETQPTPVENE